MSPLSDRYSQQADSRPIDEDRMWREIKRHLGVMSFERVSWEAIYRAKRELGYPLSAWELEILWRHS